MTSTPAPAPPRARRWLRWLGLAVLVFLLVLAGAAVRLKWQHAQHTKLREAEVGRAPVAAPKRVTPTAVPALPTLKTLCLHGVVTNQGAPVGNMQVSIADPSRTDLGPCPVKDCQRLLPELLAAPRSGLLEPVRSTFTTEDGRFQLCGLSQPAPTFLWGEDTDGHLAMPSDLFTPFDPQADLALGVIRTVPIEGLVETSSGQPIAARLLVYSVPSVMLVELKSDATGRFSGNLPRGPVAVIVAPASGAPSFVSAQVQPREPLLLTLPEPFSLTVRALEKGQPVASAEVRIGGGEPRLTNQQGEATFEALTEVQQSVSVKKGSLIGSIPQFARPQRSTRLDVELEPGVRVRGSVIDEKGEPRIAKVAIKGERVETDAKGHFESAVLEKGDYVVRAFVDGCTQPEAVSVQADRDVQVLVELTCEPTVSGAVVDAEGSPIFGAVVGVSGATGEVTETAGDGRFFLHVPKGVYQLSVQHPRYRTEERPMTAPAKDVTVVLDAGGSIAGRVVDERGEPLAGVEVYAVAGVIDELLRHVESLPTSKVTTGDDGSFVLSGLLAGRWFVMVMGTGLPSTPSEPIMLQPGEHRAGVVVKVEGQVDLTGVVLDDQRKPIAGVRVRWQPRDERAAMTSLLLDVVAGRMEELVRYLPSDVASDPSGRFALRNVQVKNVRVSAWAPGYESVDVEAAKGDSVELVLERDHHFVVRGRVEGAGRPVARFELNGRTFSNAEGTFELSVSSPTEHLRVSARGFVTKTTRLQLKSKDKEQDLGVITLTRGVELQVEAKNERGAPLEGVNLVATQAEESRDCVTKADGTCTIDALEAAPAKVTARKQGFLEKTVDATPGGGQRVTLTLSAAGGRVTGTVFAVPGRPAIARRVTVSSAADTTFALTDENGRFTESGLAEGAGCVSVDLSGVLGTGWAVPVRVSKEPEPAVLGPREQGGVLVTTTRLPGRAVLVSGSAASLSASKVGNGDASGVCLDRAASVITYVTTGEARLEGVPPGRWSVFLVSLADMDDDERQITPVIVDIGPGETKRVP